MLAGDSMYGNEINMERKMNVVQIRRLLKT